MNRKRNALVVLFVLFELLASQSEALQCLNLFEQHTEKKVARLFMSPVKKVPSISDLNISAQFLNSEKVLSEARAELKRRSHMTKADSVELHVDFLAAQVPEVLKMLDLLSASEMQRKYFLINRTGEKIENVDTISTAIEHLKKISHKALVQKNVTTDFYANIVMDVLAIHYTVMKNIDFGDFNQFEKYRGEQIARKNRPKFKMDDETSGSDYVEITPLIRFLNKMVEVKQKIYMQAQDGYLLWPTFSALKSDDFQDVHLGIKLIGVTLDRELIFDGNVSDFFGLAIHDVTNHTVQKDLLNYKNEFSKFKSIFFNHMQSYSGVTLEILKKIWFIGTHEGSQSIFREYLLIQKKLSTVEDSVKSLGSDLGSSIVYRGTGTDIHSVLSGQLKSPMFFLPEASDQIKNMSQQDLNKEVQSAWDIFLRIYGQALNEQVK